MTTTSITKPTRCAFCKAKWDPGVHMIKSQDETKLICTDCIKKASDTLEHHAMLGTQDKVIRPRVFNQ